MLYCVKLSRTDYAFEMLFAADCEADVRRIIETASLMHDEPSRPTVIISIQAVAES